MKRKELSPDISKKQFHYAQTLAEHKEEIEEVIQEAKDKGRYIHKDTDLIYVIIVGVNIMRQDLVPQDKRFLKIRYS